MHGSWTDSLSDLTDITKRSVPLSDGTDRLRPDPPCREKVCPIVAIRAPEVSRKGLSDCRHSRAGRAPSPPHERTCTAVPTRSPPASAVKTSASTSSCAGSANSRSASPGATTVSLDSNTRKTTPSNDYGTDRLRLDPSCREKVCPIIAVR
jgi:hypothetical protein